MIKKIISHLIPKVDERVEAAVDRKSLNSVWRTCLVMLFFEVAALTLFVTTREELDHDAWVSIESASFCLIACLIGVLCSGWMLKIPNLPHVTVAVFNGCFYLLLSSWAVQVAYRNYGKNEQILTFFAVQLMMVCFLPMKPIWGIFFSSIIYISMYVALYSIDGGAGLNIFNYGLLLIVTITGMIVRYYSEISAAEKAVEIEKTNDMLFYNSRHDGLTGMRNRKALEEDVPKILNKNVTVYMMDVNYFKEINDTYGHATGDVVLKETAAWLKSVFNADRCYRYGGDEFLVLSVDEKKYEDNTCTINIDELPDVKVLLSIGRAEGTPEDRDALYSIISEADDGLYEVKKLTHSEEYGGHGERK